MDGQPHPPAREVIAAVDRWSREAVLAAADEIARRPARPASEMPCADAALREVVVVAPGRPPHPPLRRMLAWAALLSARGGRLDQQRVVAAIRGAEAGS